MEKNFCIYNGRIEKIEELKTAPIFLVNDFVLDNLRLFSTRPLCLGMHVQNIIKRLELKQQKAPDKFTTDNLDRYIHSLLNVNKVYKSGICHILVFWQKFPNVGEPEFCIFTEAMPNNILEFNTQGFILELNQNTTGKMNYFPTESNISQKEETIPCDIDKYGNIYDANGNDLILLRDDQIIVCDKIRPFTTYFIEYLARKNWVVTKIPSFTAQDIFQSSEILFCNPFDGIQWIKRVVHTDLNNTQSFGVKHAKTIFSELNSAIEEM